MKSIICSTCGVIGGFITYLVGGWDMAILTLLIFMAIDYITGLIVAGIFHKSKKTASGGLNSKIGFLGLAKKVIVFLLIIVAQLLDLILGIDFVRNGVIIAFITNEVISIIENAGLMGVPMPKVIHKALDLLQDQTEGG